MQTICFRESPLLPADHALARFLGTCAAIRMRTHRPTSSSSPDARAAPDGRGGVVCQMP